MRKKIMQCGKPLPSGAMSGRAAAPAFLTIPKISNAIQREIISSGDDYCLELLSFLSNCLDLSQPSGSLSKVFNPAATLEELLCDRLSGWIYRDHEYKFMERVFYPELTIMHPESAKNRFSDTFYTDDLPMFFVKMAAPDDQNSEYNAAYLRTLPEVEAKAILTLLDETPVYVMTPATMLSVASRHYWMDFEDESERMRELELNQDEETLAEDIQCCIPIVRDDFNVAFPEWTLDRKKHKYSGTLPAAVQRLQSANRKYRAVRNKHKIYPEYVTGTLPGIRLTGLESETIQAEAIFNKIWDDIIEEASNCTGITYLCPFLVPISIDGGYNATVALLELLRAYLDCMDATAELLLWLQANAPKELKVTA